MRLQGQVLPQQYLLDRHLAVQELIGCAPHLSHSATADRLKKHVAPIEQHSRFTRHGLDNRAFGVLKLTTITRVVATRQRQPAAISLLLSPERRRWCSRGR